MEFNGPNNDQYARAESPGAICPPNYRAIPGISGSVNQTKPLHRDNAAPTGLGSLWNIGSLGVHVACGVEQRHVTPSQVRLTFISRCL